MSNKILVIGELKDRFLRNVSFESIAAAKMIDSEAEIVGVICGDINLDHQAQEMISYGADRMIIMNHIHLKNYTSDGFGQAIMEVIKEEDPNGIVLGHTAFGKDLAPNLASKLELGLVSDVTNIEKNDKEILFTKPIYSGKAFEKKIIKDKFKFITIRPNNIRILEKDESRKGNIKDLDVEIKDLRTTIKEVIQKRSEGIDLSEAKVVVAGGRGVKSAEGFKPLYELAGLLGGAVGASRGACDANYCDYSLQIGQTGKVITPDLYIAVGISGAIQHLAGMSQSKIIVAINKDPDATIFNIADYGIVGDLFDIVPLLIEEIKKLKS